MLDPVRMLEALAAAAITAAAVFLACGLVRKVHPAWSVSGAVLGLALGFSVGCACLGLRPHWPPREDQDRLLLILLPAAIVVELLVPALEKWKWLPRAAIAAGAPWILLFGSAYLNDLAGPGSREWSPKQAGLILIALATALAVVWFALTTLASRTAGRSVPLALALACAGAAITVMLSGYASGGQLGLPLAAAWMGVILASLIFVEPLDFTGAIGIAVVGLFALLAIGRFFGQLATSHAVVLFLAPLLGWLPELPLVRQVGPRLRAFGRLALAVVPVVIILSVAQQKFVRESARTTTGTTEGSVEDYMNYGK